jgi:hypothetical protein
VTTVGFVGGWPGASASTESAMMSIQSLQGEASRQVRPNAGASARCLQDVGGEERKEGGEEEGNASNGNEPPPKLETYRDRVGIVVLAC